MVVTASWVRRPAGWAVGRPRGLAGQRPVGLGASHSALHRGPEKPPPALWTLPTSTSDWEERLEAARQTLGVWGACTSLSLLAGTHTPPHPTPGAQLAALVSN